MADAAFGPLARFLSRWIGGVTRAAWLTVLLAVFATGTIGYYVAANLSINTDTDDMLSPDLPFRKNSLALKQAFPQLTDDVVIVIDGKTPELADEAAVRLGKRMREQPEVYGNVYDPASMPFFRHNGLLYLDVDELYDLSDRLAEAQPFLGALWQDPSLRGLSEMLGLALDAAAGEHAGDLPIELDKVLDAISDAVEAQAQGRFAPMSWRLLMGMGDDEGAPYRHFVLIEPPLDYSSLQPVGKAIKGVRTLVGELDLTGENGVRVRMTGSAAMAGDELKSVEEGMGLAGVLSLTLVIVLLLLAFRSPSLAAATFLTLVMGLVWTAGFAVLAIGELNLISVAFAVLFIGLSVDFGIHFVLRFRETAAGGAKRREAMIQAGRGVGGALALCAVAAAIGFFSFLPTAYRGLAELGLIAGAGMFIALFSNLTVLPALIALLPIKGAKRAATSRWGEWIGSRIRQRPRPVLWGALVLAIGAAALFPQAHFDFDPLSLRDPETESVATYLDILEQDQSGPYSATVLTKNLPEAEALTEKLEKLDEVKRAVSLARYVPENQDEKLEIIGEMALFLSPSLAGPKAASTPSADQNREALARLQDKLAELSGREGPVAEAAKRLGDMLQGLEKGGRISDSDLQGLQRQLISGLPAQLATLRQSLRAGPVTLDSLPQEIASREVAADGRARLKIYPRENLTDRAALKRFVAAIRTVAPQATGGPVIILEAGDAVVAAFRDAALIAVGLIAILLVVVLRNPREVLLVFAPLLLATLLTVAFTVLFNLPFNFANVIVLPLLFGLGVANGIHVVSRNRQTEGQGEVFATSTPRAVLFSGLTTIGSFASLGASSHPGTASMGILLTVAIFLTMACTLILLPALMAMWGGKGSG